MRNLATDEPTQRTALGYLRISDKSQIEGESKATQKEYIQRYAERENIKVIGWYYDEARSGKNADREELQNMLRVALTSKKKIDHVIVYKMNRASRDLPTYVRDIFLTLASKGITVRSATEPFDDTPFGRFMQHLHVLIAQLDNEQKSEMVVHNMARVAEQGYWQGRPLRGYRTIRVSAGGSTKHTTLEKTEEADRITDILLRFNRGDILISELCRYATSIGVLSESGRPLTQETVTKWLKNIGFAGYVSNAHTGYEPVLGMHAGLIPLDIFEQNQEILLSKNKAYLIGKKHTTIHQSVPLYPFIKCMHCHKHMTRERPGGKYRYTCKRCKGSGTILAELVHAQFETLLQSITPEDSTLKLMKEILKRTAVKEVGNLNKDIKMLHERLDGLSSTRLAAVKKILTVDYLMRTSGY